MSLFLKAQVALFYGLSVIAVIGQYLIGLSLYFGECKHIPYQDMYILLFILAIVQLILVTIVSIAIIVVLGDDHD